MSAGSPISLVPSMLSPQPAVRLPLTNSCGVYRGKESRRGPFSFRSIGDRSFKRWVFSETNYTRWPIVSAKRGLYFPSGLTITKAQVERVADEVREIQKTVRG